MLDNTVSAIWIKKSMEMSHDSQNSYQIAAKDSGSRLQLLLLDINLNKVAEPRSFFF